MKSFLQSLLIVVILSCIRLDVTGQVGIGTSSPNANAVLELKSPGNNQGFLVPRLTTSERTAPAFAGALTAAEKGLLVFDTNDNKFYYWSGSAWIVIEDSVGTGTVTNIATGTGLTGGPITVTGTLSLADNGVTTIKINNDAVTSSKILDGTVSSADITDGTIATADLANSSVTATKLANTTVAAGSYGTGTQVSQITIDAQGRITSAANVTITGAAPTGVAGGNLTGTYPNPTIAAGAGTNIVTAVNDGATTGTVNTNRLNTGVVLETESPVGGDVSGNFSAGLQLNANTVTSAEISDGTITSTDITDATIATADLANGSVTSAKLANTTVVAGSYGTGTQVSQITIDAQGRITSAANVTVTGAAPVGTAGGHLSGSYPNPTIAAAAGTNIVTAVNDAATTGTINTNKLNPTVVLDTESPAAGDITGNFTTGLQISTNAVTTSEILDATIATGDIANTAVTDVKIASGITVSKLTASATNGQVLTTVAGATAWASLPASGTVTNISTGAGLTGGPITSTGTVSLADNGVTTIKVVDDAITSAKLQDDAVADANRAVTTNHIRDNAITATKILDGTIVNADLSATAGVAVTKLAAGANTQVLTTVAGVPTWQAPVDNSASNELQTLSVAGSTLTISSGNSVTLPGGGVGGNGATGQVAYWSDGSNITGNSNLFWNEKDAQLGIGVTPKTNLHLGGSHAAVFTIAKDGPYEIIPKDYVVFCAPGTTDILLPDAAEIPGRILFIRATDPKAVTIRSLSGKDKIDGLDILQIQDSDNSVYAVTLISAGGTNWMSLSKSRK